MTVVSQNHNNMIKNLIINEISKVVFLNYLSFKIIPIQCLN